MILYGTGIELDIRSLLRNRFYYDYELAVVHPMIVTFAVIPRSDLSIRVCCFVRFLICTRRIRRRLQSYYCQGFLFVILKD